MTYGILVAADQNQEWLLPWWWKHYTKENRFPVVFCDLGMSIQARTWCEERGSCFSLPPMQLPPVALKRRQEWEKILGPIIWSLRPAWFQKPFAMQRSPFQQTIWLDLDCQVLRELSPLFSALQLGVELALVRASEAVQRANREKGLLLLEEVEYNSGVIAYQKGAHFLGEWCLKVQRHSAEFLGDQNVLNRVLWEQQIPRLELSPLYNWSLYDGEHPEARIVHYVSAYWKMALLKRLKPHLGASPKLPPNFDPEIAVN